MFGHWKKSYYQLLNVMERDDVRAAEKRAKYESNINSLCGQFNRLKDEFDKLKEENDELKLDKQELENAHAVLHMSFTEAKIKVNDRDETIDDLELQNRQLLKRVEDLEAEFKQAVSTFSAIRTMASDYVE